MSSNQTYKVAVLMSTYNGEDFLKDQINSIFAQKDVIVDLYIRDDGSKDHTLEIIQSFTDNKLPIHLIVGNKNVGPGLSFMMLLYYLRDLGQAYDYYAFSDQDDVWGENKLINAIEKILNESEKGTLYCSNQTLYINGEIKGLRHSYVPDLSLKGHISKNYISGCTFVFDYVLFERITNTEFPDESLIKKRCHDSWIILEAIICGRVIYDPNSFILYRIHANNAVGIKKQTLFTRLNRLLDPSKTTKKIRSSTAKELLKRFPNTTSDNLEVLKEFSFYTTSWKYKRQLIKDKSITDFTGENQLFFAIKVLLNYI